MPSLKIIFRIVFAYTYSAVQASINNIGINVLYLSKQLGFLKVYNEKWHNV
jgi:hypothetical protein